MSGKFPTTVSTKPGRAFRNRAPALGSLPTRGHGEQVIVVGGGIGGLTTAFRLQRLGYAVTVLERDDHVGGRMVTSERDGFRMDRAASVLTGAYTAMISLIVDAGLADDVIATNDLVGIVDGQGTTRLRAGRLLNTALLRALTPRSALQALRVMPAAVRNGRAMDWTVTDSVVGFDTGDVTSHGRGNGPEFAHRVVDPLIRGLAMREADGVSVVQAYFWLARLLGAGWFNFPKGVGFLPTNLAVQLDVRLNAEVLEVLEKPGECVVTWVQRDGTQQTETAAAVVVAVPAPQAVALLPEFPAPLRERLRKIGHIPAVSVHLGLDRPPREPAAWLAFRRDYDPALTSVILDHNKVAGRVPPGRGMLTMFWNEVWSQRNFHDKDAAVAAAVAAADRLFPGTAEQVCLAEVDSWPYFPGQAPGCYDEIRQLMARNTTRIRFAGDFYASTGATNAAVATGDEAARDVHVLIQERRP